MNARSRIRALAVVALFMAGTTGWSQTKESANRLLPDSLTKTITYTWKQDGRVVELAIRNPSDKWVIEKIQMEVRFKPTKLAFAGNTRRNKSGQLVLDPKPPQEQASSSKNAEEYYSEQTPEKHVVSVSIQPGKSGAAHIELEFSSPVESLVAREARGREQSTLERMKSRFF